MSTVQQTERAKYEDIWSSVDTYGTHAPGANVLPVFLDMVGSERGTVLDAGCGSGKGAVALKAAGFTVWMCDVTEAGLVTEAQALPFANACLWQDLRVLARGAGHPGRTRFDYVYCCDVLEHIPPEFTMLVIRNLLAIARHGVFLSISLVPDNFGVWIGQPLHQTVRPFTWWKQNISELGELVEARDLLDSGIYFVRPR